MPKGTSLQETPYEVISPDQLALLRRNVVRAATELYPEAGLVGGAALRVWCDVLGILIPAEFGGDIDMAQADIDKMFDNRTSPAGWVDVFPSDVPIDEPFFREIAYQNCALKIASLPHLLAHKITAIREGIAERENIMRKDLVYLAILELLVNEAEMNTYLQAQKNLGHIPQSIDYKAELSQLHEKIDSLRQADRIHDAVHPENAVDDGPL